MNLVKYPNRKLYNKDTSRTVSLAQVFQHVRSGGNVKVTDFRTRVDITDQVLVRALGTYTRSTAETLARLIREA